MVKPVYSQKNLAFLRYAEGANKLQQCSSKLLNQTLQSALTT